jgi:peptidoglycan/LPS O-acetylase OafA/YrhL
MPTIISIQALRAVAAIAVAVCHFSQVALLINGRANDPIPGFQLAAGVDLFFVISGFIMVYSAEPLFAAPGGARKFLTHRLARIVPLYWVTTLIAIPLFSQPYDWTELACSLLFIPCARASGEVAPINGVGWTLNYEMFFYVLFACALSCRRRIAVPTVCAALAAIALFGLISTPQTTALQFWSQPIVSEFAFGALIALLYRSGVSLGWAPRCALAIAAIGAIAWATPTYPLSWHRPLCWGIPAAALVAAIALGPDLREGPLATVAKRLGDASYSVYLIHPLMGGAFILMWVRSPHPNHQAALLTIALVLTIGLSVGVYYLFERPTTRTLAAALSWPRRTVAYGETRMM